MGNKSNHLIVTLAILALSGCELSNASDTDSGVDGGSLETLVAGIWVDGNGCDHWIIDDGFEGYMTPRFGKNGKPLCREGSVPFETLDFNRSLFGLD